MFLETETLTQKVKRSVPDIVTNSGSGELRIFNSSAKMSLYIAPKKLC